MTHSGKEIDRLVKRYVAGNLSRGEKIRLGKNEDLKKKVTEIGDPLIGKAIAEKEAGALRMSAKLLGAIEALEGAQKKAYLAAKSEIAAKKGSGSKSVKKDKSGEEKPSDSSKTSSLVRSMHESKDATLRHMTEVLRRELTLVEYADRIDVAPATLTKALDIAGLTYESFRAAALGTTSVPTLAAMMTFFEFAGKHLSGDDASIDALRSVFTGALEKSKSVVASLPPAAPAAESAEASATSSEVATKSEYPETLEDWKKSFIEARWLRGGEVVGKDHRINDLASKFLLWSLRQPSELENDSSEMVQNKVRVSPWSALLGVHSAGFDPANVNPAIMTATCAVIAQAVQIRWQDDWDGHDLFVTAVWLVENKAAGLARMLTAMCHMAQSPTVTMSSRRIRAELFVKIREQIGNEGEQSLIPREEYGLLVQGADPQAAQG